jgi:hypothetical protein
MCIRNEERENDAIKNLKRKYFDLLRNRRGNTHRWPEKREKTSQAI